MPAHQPAADPFAANERGSVDPDEPSGCGRVAKGCGCVVVVALLLVVMLGAWIAVSWRSWAAFAGRRAADAMLAAAPLADADRVRIRAAVDRLGDEFTAGRITVEQMGRVAEEVARGPLLPLAVLMAIDLKYLQPSGLPPEERTAGRRLLERAARGLTTGVIEPEVAADLLEPVVEPAPDAADDVDSFALKEKLTDAELREFLRRVRERVDALGIPDEPFAVDVATEVEAAIHRALGRRAEAGGD